MLSQQDFQNLRSKLKSLILSRGSNDFLNSLTTEERDELDGNFWQLIAARDSQLPEFAEPQALARSGAWNNWLVLAGRGFGKTRVGAEWITEKVRAGQHGRIALVAKDPGEARDVMVEGESGLQAVAPKGWYPKYEPSKKRVSWPNGVIATTYSSEEYDELRGPQHHLAWVDELLKYRYAQETWDQLMFGLRLGQHPQCCITSTPRPTKLLKLLMADPHTIVTRGSTYDNKANLAPSFFSNIIRRYEGTRLGRQELDAAILDDNPSALWSYALIDRTRVMLKDVPPMRRVVVAIDPAVTWDEDSADTGIAVAGLGEDDHGYLFGDFSEHVAPERWAQKAITLLETFSGDRIIGEVNNGGDLIESVLRNVDRTVPYRSVHASRGKRTRAEPISALYEQGRIHHVGTFPELEDQMCEYDPLTAKKSPDRMDAMVWAFTDLFGRGTVDIEGFELGARLTTVDGHLGAAVLEEEDSDEFAVLSSIGYLE